MKRVKLHLLESGWEFVVRSAAAELLASFQRDQKFIKNSVMVVDWAQHADLLLRQLSIPCP